MQSEIYFYVWPHQKPHGTFELIHTGSPQVKDEREALRVLDTAYDLVRHRYVLQLCREDGSAAFRVDSVPPSKGASFQVSMKGIRSYSAAVSRLNEYWLANRSSLAEALVGRG